MRIESPWTQKMNKKQYEKTASNKVTKNKPLYMNNPLYKKRQEKLQTDRFLWGVGFVIITIIIGLFIWAMIEML